MLELNKGDRAPVQTEMVEFYRLAVSVLKFHHFTS